MTVVLMVKKVPQRQVQIRRGTAWKNFQEKLCSRVPNGGEVIIDNEYNDLECAIADLKTMHVTYLNQDYDAAVLEKWASSAVQTSDCFDGMEGLSYIERHLGYRLVLSDVFMQYSL